MLEQRWTDTCDFADVVLPATMQPEHLDLHTSYGHHYTTLNVPVTDAAGRGAAEHRDLPPASPPPWGSTTRGCATATRTSCASCWPATGTTYEELRETTYVRATGVARRHARRSPRAASPRRRAARGCSTPSLARRGVDPLVGYTPPVEAADAELAERFPLVLVAPAGRFFMNSTFASLPWHVGASRARRWCTCTPTTRRPAAWPTASPVRVHNDRGSFVAAVRGRRRHPARPGVHLQGLLGRASAPAASNVNAVTAVRDTDLGGGPTFHDTRVEVERVPAELLETPPPEVEQLVAGD